MFRSITGLEFDTAGLVTGLEASILPVWLSQIISVEITLFASFSSTEMEILKKQILEIFPVIVLEALISGIPVFFLFFVLG